MYAGFWVVTLLRDVRGLFAASQREVASPGDVNIEPTNLCNANCVFCAYQFQERPRMQVDSGLAHQIIAAAKRAGVKRLGLTPIVGEPLVHRQLEEFIRDAVQEPNPLQVGLTTNGIRLTPQRFRSLVDAGLSSIDISMSFPDEGEYRRIYRSGQLKTVLDNIAGILDTYQSGDCQVRLALRTSRLAHWDDHPLLHRARRQGWIVTRNSFFDDWSGSVSGLISQEGLLLRPNRPKILPCTMTYAGPHFLSDGRATACGCRDLDGNSDLALDASSLLCERQRLRLLVVADDTSAFVYRARISARTMLCVGGRHARRPTTLGGESQQVRSST